jgi:hypothetical protein
MEITLSLDLSGMLSDVLAPDRLRPIVDKAIMKAVESAIDQATGYNSKFRKDLALQLGDALPHGLSVASTAKFQHVLNTAVASAVGHFNADTVAAALHESVRSILPEIQKDINLSDLMKEARESSLGGAGSFFAEMEHYGNGGVVIFLDHKKTHSSRYSSEIILQADDSGNVYSLRLNSKTVQPLSLPSAIGRFESLLLALYTGRSRLVIDMDEDEVQDCASNECDD